jgi:hypothetical protein
MWVLERDGHICSVQSGFRKNRSTTDNLVQFETYVQQAISHRLHTVVVFFDIAKAYDTALRHGVLHSLHQYNIRGNMPMFVKGFLQNRLMQVRVGKTLSQPVPTSQGIPQGSVLSCTCFMIAINSIANSLPANISSSLYVDDFAIYSSGTIPQAIERRIQLALNNLDIWSKSTGFTFSPEKTVTMHICRRRSCPKMAHQLSIANHPIRSVESCKFIGLIIDNSFTWKPHITVLKLSCRKILDFMKHIAHKKWGADRETILRL